MSVITSPHKVLRALASNKKVCIAQDFIIMTPLGGGLAYMSVARFNHNMDLVWWRQLWENPAVMYGGLGTPREGVLSYDRERFFVCGWSVNGAPRLYCLNARTGATIWSADTNSSAEEPSLICRDNSDNIFTEGTGWCKKFNSSGSLQWTIYPTAGIQEMACDSAGNLYVVQYREDPDPDEGWCLVKYNSSGTLQWSVHDFAGEAQYLFDITITDDDDIYVCGDYVETYSGSGVYWNIWKYNTAGAVVASGNNNADLGVPCNRLVHDKIGHVYAGAAPGGHLTQLNSSLTRQWVNVDLYNIVSGRLAVDAHNRVHYFGIGFGGLGSHVIRDEDGVEDLKSTRKGSHPTPFAVMCKEVYVAHLTDQEYQIDFPDMCCFLDDSYPEYAGNGDWDLDEIVWWDNIETGLTWWENISGIWICLWAHVFENPTWYTIWPRWMKVWEQLSRTPSCQNVAWNQYTRDSAEGGAAFGGVGNCPKIYTVSFIGMLNMSDDGVSQFNGEYLLMRGPGHYGFFFGVRHDLATRINFTVHNEDSADDKEMLHFGSDALPSSIFNYNTASNHDEKLTHVLNENVKTPTPTTDAIAYGGYASMYPGRRPRWDATTVWAVGRVVAWHGYFYVCILESTNNEPPNGTYWTQL